MGVALLSPLKMPFHTVLIGALLMLRFAELFILLCAYIVSEKERGRVTIRISAGKTDAPAKSMKMRCATTASAAMNTHNPSVHQPGTGTIRTKTRATAQWATAECASYHGGGTGGVAHSNGDPETLLSLG